MSSEPRLLVADVRVTLPADWWATPLADEATWRRAVEALLDRQFDGWQDNPLLRSELRRTISAQAEAAAAAGAQLLALSLQQVHGVPVPASLVLSRIDVAVDAGEDVLGDLQESLRPNPDAPLPAGTSLDLARLPVGRTLRRVQTQATAIEPGQEPLPTLTADYWLEHPAGDAVLHLAFSTPLVALRDSLLELFDAVVSALRWFPADAPAEGPPRSPTTAL